MFEGDEEILVELLLLGMPPAGGIGIDRLCPAPAGLLGQETIRDVILFSQLKLK